MTEAQFTTYLKANNKLKPRTITQYKNSYDKFDDMSKNILTASQGSIIDYIEQYPGSDNTKLALLNVASNMRKHYTKQVNKILTKKEEYKDNYQVAKEKDHKEKLTSLPSTKEVIAHENKLYRDGEYLGFIITHLMRVLSLRNMDLDMKIIPPTRSLRKVKEEDRTNYMVPRKNNTMIVRNNYKTQGKYGVKKNAVASRKLQRAIKALIDERELTLGKDTIWLMSSGTGKHLGEDSIAKKIRSYTLNGMSESDMNKIFVTQVAEIKDMAKLRKISENRGTSLEVLLNEYHLEL